MLYSVFLSFIVLCIYHVLQHLIQHTMKDATVQILLIQVYSVMMNVHVELKFVGQLILKLKCLQNCLRKPQDFYNENKCLHGMYRGLSQECFISIHYLIC